jgi:hypothetical protein
MYILCTRVVQVKDSQEIAEMLRQQKEAKKDRVPAAVTADQRAAARTNPNTSTGLFVTSAVIEDVRQVRLNREAQAAHKQQAAAQRAANLVTKGVADRVTAAKLLLLWREARDGPQLAHLISKSSVVELRQVYRDQRMDAGGAKAESIKKADMVGILTQFVQASPSIQQEQQAPNTEGHAATASPDREVDSSSSDSDDENEI